MIYHFFSGRQHLLWTLQSCVTHNNISLRSVSNSTIIWSFEVTTFGMANIYRCQIQDYVEKFDMPYNKAFVNTCFRIKSKCKMTNYCCYAAYKFILHTLCFMKISLAELLYMLHAWFLSVAYCWGDYLLICFCI